MGIESPEPIINDRALALNFTNEGGVGSIRFLKNVMGLWLVQECRRTWEEAGRGYSFGELAAMAQTAEPLVSVVDPDDETFLKPCDMPQMIREFCKRTNQPGPADDAAVIRTALDSLALKYRWVIEGIESITGRNVDRIHIVGGGTQNRLLSQLTADLAEEGDRRTGRGDGHQATPGAGHGLRTDGSVAQGREVVRASFEVETYQPRPQAKAGEAFGKLKTLIE